MRVRKVSADGDMVFGRGIADFHVDSPEGVAQVAGQRMALWQSQWFLDLDEGTPWMTHVLGVRTTALHAVALRARLLGTPGATGIAAFQSVPDAASRTLYVTATLDTEYGAAAVRAAVAAGGTAVARSG